MNYRTILYIFLAILLIALAIYNPYTVYANTTIFGGKFIIVGNK
jgi:hypothetical protein